MRSHFVQLNYVLHFIYIYIYIKKIALAEHEISFCTIKLCVIYYIYIYIYKIALAEHEISFCTIKLCAIFFPCSLSRRELKEVKIDKINSCRQ